MFWTTVLPILITSSYAFLFIIWSNKNFLNLALKTFFFAMMLLTMPSFLQAIGITVLF